MKAGEWRPTNIGDSLALAPSANNMVAGQPCYTQTVRMQRMPTEIVFIGGCKKTVFDDIDVVSKKFESAKTANESFVSLMALIDAGTDSTDGQPGLLIHVAPRNVAYISAVPLPILDNNPAH